MKHDHTYGLFPSAQTVFPVWEPFRCLRFTLTALKQSLLIKKSSKPEWCSHAHLQVHLPLYVHFVVLRPLDSRSPHPVWSSGINTTTQGWKQSSLHKGIFFLYNGITWCSSGQNLCETSDLGLPAWSLGVCWISKFTAVTMTIKLKMFPLSLTWFSLFAYITHNASSQLNPESLSSTNSGSTVPNHNHLKCLPWPTSAAS